MTAVGECGGEEVDVASLLDLESFAKLCDGGGEVADGQVGLPYPCENMLDASLAKVANSLDDELSTRETRYGLPSHKEVAHGVKLMDVVALAELVLHTGLEDGCVGLEE